MTSDFISGFHLKVLNLNLLSGFFPCFGHGKYSFMGLLFLTIKPIILAFIFELITGTKDLSVMSMEDMLSLSWERTIINTWIQISNFHFYHRLASFEDISFCKKFQKIIQQITPQLFFTVSKSQNFAKENSFWKFNSLLIYDKMYVSKMKKLNCRI